MSTLRKHCKSFCERTMWLAPLMGGKFNAAKYLVQARAKPLAIGHAQYHDLAFQFRNYDTTALREVLIDDEYDFLTLLLETQKPLKIVDVGAHIGTFSLWAYNKNTNITLTAVEADPKSYEILTQNLQGNLPANSWKTINKAASNTNEAKTFTDQGDSMGHRVCANGGLEIDGITLADIVKDEKVDLMKIDIEGSEEGFLCQAPELLKNIERIVIELHPKLCDTERVREILNNRYNKITEVAGRINSKPVLYCES